jgi:hypothetical protein
MLLAFTSTQTVLLRDISFFTLTIARFKTPVGTSVDSFIKKQSVDVRFATAFGYLDAVTFHVPQAPTHHHCTEYKTGSDVVKKSQQLLKLAKSVFGVIFQVWFAKN